ncbi:dipeptidase [Shewanella sp. SHSM-M6]|uniref:Dipeptidase n=2 Tax=Shewanella salipaludis TaxID=2723052 RepID=A0A972FPZ7_9GAMM|nr:dipeptidase [Shewanella salipaludis]
MKSSLFRPMQLAALLAGLALPSLANALTPIADTYADYAVKTYDKAMVDSLARLVSFNTQAKDGLTPSTNPEFLGFKDALQALSEQLGLDYQDHGYVILIGLGQSSDKLGVITHGDVQPADPKLWAQSPYLLDTHSEPGKLIGRGTEDDKGAIVTAMYAMKAIKDKGLELNKRIELMVYLAEESDWDPLKHFLTGFTPANINITIDAEYPVVTAEKGWSKINFRVPPQQPDTQRQGASLTEFGGGYFGSQIPQQARATIQGADAALVARLKALAAKQAGMHYGFELTGDSLSIAADGKAAHSSTPEDGVNAVTHLAELLALQIWPKTQASLTQNFIHQLVGLGLYAEKFGELAYSDSFMGPLTLAPTVVKQTPAGTEVTLNLRRPRGKAPALLDSQALQALAHWQAEQGVRLEAVETYWGEPMVMEDAPQQQALLEVFAHFTGIKDPQPVAIGGSTNSKLFPNALSFGPAMPGVEYTGHTEHEFITHEQFMLNLKMYTAAFIELAGKGA